MALGVLSHADRHGLRTAANGVAPDPACCPCELLAAPGRRCPLCRRRVEPCRCAGAGKSPEARKAWHRERYTPLSSSEPPDPKGTPTRIPLRFHAAVAEPED